MKQSSKHHYLPEFYLKGFTDSQGQFAIYDCKNYRIKDAMFYPSSHFFAKDRNTIEVFGKETDLLEQTYSKFDNRHSKLLKLIRETEKPLLLDNQQMIFLQEFISHLFWRLPENDELYIKEYKANPNFTKTFKIVDRVTKQEVKNARTHEILNSESFIKSVRAVAGNISHLSYTNAQDYYNWRLSYNKTSFKLCSDSPIIFKNINSKNIFESDFIFPITQKHLLLRTFDTLEIEFLEPEICFMIDLIIFKQARIYACCSRKDYLRTISLMAHLYPIEMLKSKIFKFIEGHSQRQSLTTH